jgi:hypothetical protein
MLFDTTAEVWGCAWTLGGWHFVHVNVHWPTPFSVLLLDVVVRYACNPDSAFYVYIPGLPFLLMCCCS